MNPFPKGSYPYYYLGRLRQLELDDKKLTIRLERQALMVDFLCRREVDSGKTETDRPGEVHTGTPRGEGVRR